MPSTTHEELEKLMSDENMVSIEAPEKGSKEAEKEPAESQDASEANAQPEIELPSANSDEQEEVSDEPEDAEKGTQPEEQDGELPLPASNEREIPEWVKKRDLKLQKKYERELEERNRIIAERERQLQEMQSRFQQPVQQQAQAPTNYLNEAPPVRANFDSEEDFIDARFDYREREKEAQRQHNAKINAFQNVQMQSQQKIIAAVESGRKTYDDFDEVTQPLFSPQFKNNYAMDQAVLDSDFRHDMVYFLGKNFNEAQRIASLPPVQAVKEIVKLERRFEERAKVSPAKKIAAPLTPLKTNTPFVKQSLDKLANGSFEEFEKGWDKDYANKKNVW